MKDTMKMRRSCIALLAVLSSLLATRSWAADVVGSPQGQFAVSPTGAATYTVAIDVPPGIGGMQPQIGITYNSQSGMGNVGWGCNITGISAITRSTKDIYHDGQAGGMSYGSDDAYYLDGKRLIYVSGTEGEVGCLYHPEDEPFTDVRIESGTSGTYFEVKSPDGNTAVYGNDDNSRIAFSSDGDKVASWHVHTITNPVGRSVLYTYSNTDYYPCISNISYYNGDSGSHCWIEFSYTSLGDAAQKFRLMNVEGKMDRRLTEIKCKVGGTVGRVYTFSYDTTSDGTAVKFPRLTGISVADGSGNSLRPITLQWNHLPSYSTASSGTLSCNANYPSGAQISDRAFISSDLNGDGISDIVQIATDNISYTKNSYLSFHLSHQNSSGNIGFSPTASIAIGPSFDVGKMLSQKTSCFGDIDGDGLTDYLLTYFNSEHIGNTSSVFVRPFYGSSGTPATLPSDSILGIGLHSVTDEMPPYSMTDLDNDGISEFLMIDNTSTRLRPCYLFSTDSSRTMTVHSTLLTLPEVPKKLFVADFNGDGMQDLFILHQSGYKIYWNQGGTSLFSYVDPFYHFSDTDGAWTTGSGMSDAAHVEMGDFNGDGLPDFISNDTNSNKYQIALNNGDGTFSYPAQNTIDIFDEDKEEDDGKYILLVNDFDHDGKSDILLAHSHYEYHGWLHSTTYEYTDVRWYRSTGSSLQLLKSVRTHTTEDAWAGHITLGDVNGDGIADIINYGGSITQNSNTSMGLSLRVSQDASSLSTGKISSVTDGFGNTTQISYASLASPSVYTKGSGCTYPLVDLAAPLHVVSTVKTPTVATSSPSSLMTETYTYEGLKAHVAGRGLLGFAKTTVANDIMGTAVVSETGGWSSNDYFAPTGTTTTTYLGSVGSSTRSTTATSLKVVSKNSGTRKNFFTYPLTVAATDLDGFTTATTYTYDEAKGVPTLERTVFDGNTSNYKQVAYTYGSAKYGGRWQPVQTVSTQQHPDDAQPFSTSQTVTYDAATGLPTQVVDNAHNSSLKLTTAYTYDHYGNVTGKTVSGTGLNTVTEKYDYDASRRFVVKRYTVPASTVTTYTHDLWGNVLTETDATVASSPLTTTNTYDGFGNLLTSTSPEGIVTAVSRTWGSSPTQKYLVHQTVTGRPWTKTWYDSRGRETRKESVGVKGVTLLTTASYDARGNVTAKTSQTGDITSTSSMTYDGRNRLSSEVLSTGRSTTYQYTGRKVTATTSGNRTSEKTYDAWGLLKQSKEPIGTVSYTYKSCGKPSAAGSTGGTVTMAYDNCGNQIRLADPDAGTTTYAYNAAGEVISQTDARGITTRDSLDLLNRVVRTTTGSTVTTYTYGTGGNAMHRLASQSMDGRTISYGYDQYGRVTSETRSSGSTSYTTSYTYDNSGNLLTTTYPGNVQVTHGYDGYGNETSIAVGGSTVWTLTSHTGTATVETLGTGTSALKRSTSRNSHGLLTGITLQKASSSSTLHAMTFQHDAVTGNLTRRTGMIYDGEVFTYDSADRLVRHQDAGSHWDNVFQYATNGNIEYKTGIGSYAYQTYGNSSKPHAVKHVDDSGSLLYTDGCEITYNDYGKATLIDSSHGGIRYDISYGPDRERWQAAHYHTDMQWPDTVRYYVGDMEGYKVGPGDPVWFYHIGHGVILRKVGNGTTNQPTAYYTFTDNLGSVTRIYNSSGTAVFSAEYDPWGVQAVTTNTIGYNRGYCGHEMLSDLQLINMNGRLYDPYIARFLSPDNYVQLPTSAQSFNRYSYCLNNPLKYVDPDGELFGLDDITLFFIGYSAMVGAWKASEQGKIIGLSALKAGASSLISALAPSFVGDLLGHHLGNWGKEIVRAGAHGLWSGITNLLDGGNFGAGYATGFLSSFSGSLVQGIAGSRWGVIGATVSVGALSSHLLGGSWLDGATKGFFIGALNHGGFGSGKNVIKHEDGSFEAINSLPEVVVFADGTTYWTLPLSGGIPTEKPLGLVYPEFDLLLSSRLLFNLGSSILNSIHEMTGGMKQWIRIGPSHSISGGFDTELSLRWGSSPYYKQTIGNRYLRIINQSLRKTKLPGDSWRVNDPGHFHIKKVK